MATTKTQYTIRGVLPEVDRALRRAAREKHMSLNRYIVEELKRLADRQTPGDLRHDLDFAIGSMSDGRLVDESLRDFEGVDEAAWK